MSADGTAIADERVFVIMRRIGMNRVDAIAWRFTQEEAEIAVAQLHGSGGLHTYWWIPVSNGGDLRGVSMAFPALHAPKVSITNVGAARSTFYVEDSTEVAMPMTLDRSVSSLELDVRPRLMLRVMRIPVMKDNDVTLNVRIDGVRGARWG